MKLFLYDFVDSFGIQEIIDSLKNPPKDEIIELHINSPGGSVFDGFNLYNRLRQIENRVEVNIDGMAGSIASVVAMAGDQINISEAGSIMIHNASAMMGGNKEDLQKQIELLKNIDKTIVNIYSKRTKLGKKQVIDLMDKETVLFADQALKLGFADNVTEPIKAVAQINLNDMNLREKLKALGSLIIGDNLESEEINKLKNEIEGKAEIETAAQIEERGNDDPAKAIFADYVPFSEYAKLKAQVTEFIGVVAQFIESQPEKEEIEQSIKENTNTELYKLLANVQSKNKVPTAKEHAETLADPKGGFDLEKAKEYHKKNKNNN